MSAVADNAVAPDRSRHEHAGQSPFLKIWRSVVGDPMGLTGVVLVAFLVVIGIAGPWVAPHDPRGVNPPKSLYGPGEEGHLFGTDELGRDVLSRVLGGARISLTIGVFVSLLSAVIGVVVGCLSGYFLGWLDTLCMRVVDFLLAFPRLILAIAVLAVAQKPSLFLVFLVLAVTGWASIARLVRAQVMQAKELEFVQAARAMGAGNARVLLVHILPHIAGVIIIWVTLAIPSTIMAEAGLSFLGLGAEPGEPSWGAMISDSREYFRYHWWVAVFPGLALAITVLGFNLLGDALQDALNPRLQDEK